MTPQQTALKRALISVYDKAGLLPFVKGLVKHGVEIVSTGNTAKALREAGFSVTEVSEITGFPEMLNGRVKTLHPKIHGGILARRDKPDHLATLNEHHIPLIDLVVINLYPFEKALERRASHEDTIEMIDIGGPTLLRAAAKNYESVAVVCDIEDYSEVLKRLDSGKGKLDTPYRKQLASKVFERTYRYDEHIAGFLKSDGVQQDQADSLPEELQLNYRKLKALRYGENPHQRSAFYRTLGNKAPGWDKAKVLGGKELSYNNYLDLDAAWSLVSAFKKAACCVIKHNNPCGFSLNADLKRAFLEAFAGDPLSAFGGIVGLNRRVDQKTAQAIFDAGFLECVVAPAFQESALKILRKKKNLRLIEMPPKLFKSDWDFKKITGGLLVQDSNLKDATKGGLKVVTRKRPPKNQVEDLLLGFKLLRFIKSNAIVLIKQGQAVGVGMGQPSRVDSVLSAIKKAGKRAQGAVMASDGFFPKADSIQVAAKHGIRAVIQPGGSIQDPTVIEASNKAKISMVFTGIRHFTH